MTRGQLAATWLMALLFCAASWTGIFRLIAWAAGRIAR